MKGLFFLILFHLPGLMWSQEIYNSPYTQHLPSGEIEDIQRIITITEDNFTISTNTLQGKDIQTLIISGTEQREFANYGSCNFFYCKSLDGLYRTIFVIPITEPVEVIEVFQPTETNREPKHYRFLVD